ncbi:D-xylose transport system permease component [Klebsiella pneumoniae]|uniref:D-xylose transport system permease component n=1 Tax=Klebsiella pneumoniae TaxID=573 RepID=A0A447RVC7_KLEPN|nr:D-xylose transport system permease component [Klebsiella pneumoniae]
MTSWLGWPLPLTILVTLVMGLLLGAWNGWWVAYRKVPSFIVTLAGMLAFRGILIGITNGTTVSPTSPAMSQIGQSYLPDGIGFGIGVVGMAVFIVWQWRGRMRRQALGLATSSSTAAVGRQAITAVIVLGAIWLLNDYRGVPTPGADPRRPAAGGPVYGHPHRLWSPHLRHRRQPGGGPSVRD